MEHVIFLLYDAQFCIPVMFSIVLYKLDHGVAKQLLFQIIEFLTCQLAICKLYTYQPWNRLEPLDKVQNVTAKVTLQFHTPDALWNIEPHEGIGVSHTTIQTHTEMFAHWHIHTIVVIIEQQQDCGRGPTVHPSHSKLRFKSRQSSFIVANHCFAAGSSRVKFSTTVAER